MCPGQLVGFTLESPWCLADILFSQTLPGWLRRQLSSDILGRVLVSYGVDGPHQHCANMVPWILGISI
jgi:hypothetical protein